MPRKTSYDQMIEVSKKAKRYKELKCAYSCTPTTSMNIQILFTISKEAAIKQLKLVNFMEKGEITSMVKEMFLKELELCERDPLNYTPLISKREKEDGQVELDED